MRGLIGVALLCLYSCIPSNSYLVENAPQISVASFTVRSIAGSVMTADLILALNNRYDADIPLASLAADAVAMDGVLVSAAVATNTVIAAAAVTRIPVSLSFDITRAASAAVNAVSKGKLTLIIRGSASLGSGRHAYVLPFEHTVTVIIPRVSLSKIGIGEINPIAGRVNLSARLAVESDASVGKLIALSYTCALNGALISSATVSNTMDGMRSEFDLSLPVYMRAASDAFSSLLARKSVPYVIDAVLVYLTEAGEQAVPYRFAGSFGGK